MFSRASKTLSHPTRIWVAAVLVAAVAGAASYAGTIRAPLSPAQEHWLLDHPVIVLANDPAWPPFSLVNDRGETEGIDAELIQLIEARLHFRFQRARVASWSGALAQARDGKIDVLSGAARSPQREDKFVFTRSYVSQSIGIVTRIDESAIATLANLSGHRVATVRGHAVTALLERDTPGARLIVAETIEQALRLVSNREADAVVVNLVNASYIIKQRGLANLKVAGITPYRFEMRFAVRRDWPELAAILDSAIAALDEADTQRIFDRWVRVEYGGMVKWENVMHLVAWSLLVAAVGMGAFVWHNRRLRRELTERNRVEQQLREAHGKLTDLNEEKSRIINMAAHDLRNPLTGILISVRLMEGAPPHEQHRFVVDITMLCRRMVRLITNLLDSQSLEEGRRSLQIESVDVAQIVRETVHENRFSAERKRILVRLENVSAPRPVHGDRGALRQVVDNLLSNAIKYSPIGGHVWLTLHHAEDVIRLSVRDDGPGISGEDLPRLFVKYGRVGNRPTGGESSIGLGLAIVRQLIEAMKGRVWCESQLGRGATFLVELPVAEVTPRHPLGPHPTSARIGSRV
jgi:two-component system sensor histidine kinase EvgS